MGIFFSRADDDYKIEQDIPPCSRNRIKKGGAHIVILFQYIGTNYHGLQFQNNSHTVDADLFYSLEKSKLLPPNISKNRGKVRWNEASRTDTGVHACAQVTSFVTNIAEGVLVADIPQIINANLPSGSSIRVLSAIATSTLFPARQFADYRRYNYLLPIHAFSSQTNEHLSYIRNNICSLFCGRKNFHNFTKGVKGTSREAEREIIDFTFGDPFDVDGIDFVLFVIKGNSFMLNQIRKMLGLVLAASHNQVNEEIIRRTMKYNEDWGIRKIPGDGLMLDMIGYESFKKKQKFQSPANDVEFITIRPFIEEWKVKVLFRHISKLEREKKIFRKWIDDDLIKHPVFQFTK